MSHNQSRSENSQGNLKRPGRLGSFGQNKGFSGGGKGGGASAPSPALPPSSSASHDASSNRNYKKTANVQGDETRANPGSLNSDETHWPVSNGAHSITSSHGPSVGLESSSSKPAESFNNKKIPRAVSKVPTQPAQSAVATSGDESGPFLQFGTINPGIMNGMQIPARTCSAPPNLDEQKRHQASHDSVRPTPVVPTPSAQKSQQALKQPPLPQKQQKIMTDAVSNQIGCRDSHPPAHSNRDMHVPISSTPSSTTVRPSVLTVGGMPMHTQTVSFPQQHMQYRGSSLQMPSQGIVPSSVQMTMTLPTGNVPQVPQSMFVTNIQSHSLQSPAILHQGQNMSFAPQLNHQLNPQLGSMGVSIAPQFHQQSTNFVSQRKAVKITHPKTHEELKLDKRADMHTDANTPGQRQLPNATSQSQSLSTFTHQIGYYPTTYNTSTMFFPTPPLPISSNQRVTGPQAARYSYPIGQNGQSLSFMNPLIVNHSTVSRPGPLHALHGLTEAANSDVSSVSTSLAAPVHVTIKPAIPSSLEKVGTQSVRISMPTKPESQNKFKLPVNSFVSPQLKDKEIVPQNASTLQKKSYVPPVQDSSSCTTDKKLTSVSSMNIKTLESSSLAATVGSATTVAEEKNESKKEALRMSDSLNDQHKMPSKMELKHFQQPTDLFESTKSMTMQHPAEIIISNSITATVGHSTSIDSASIHSSPAADSSISVISLLSTSRESRTSEHDQKNNTMAVYDPEDSPAEEPSQAASLTHFDSETVDGDRLSFEAASYSEECTSSVDVDGILLGTPDLSLNSCTTTAMEFGQMQEEGLTELKCGRESYFDLLSDSSTKLNSISASIVSSDNATVITVMEEEEKDGSQLCDSDDQHLDSLEEGGNLSETVRSGVSNVPATTFSIRKDVELAPSDVVPSSVADDGKMSATDSTILKCELTSHEKFTASESGISLSEASSMLSDSELHKPDIEPVDSITGETTYVLPGLREKPSLEPNRFKTNKKKKRKENFSKADAAGSSDLYDAYKGPDEKQDTLSTPETIEISSAANSDNNTIKGQDEIYIADKLDEQSKNEIEDWEDAADVSTPQLGSDNGHLVHLVKKMPVGYDNESSGKKKYSRDFLFTLSGHCRDLPESFDIGSDITDILICVQTGGAHGFDRDTLPSTGRILDRSSGARGDRRMTGISDDDRRMKGSNVFRMDASHGSSGVNFRSVQGVNHGVLRNPRLQSSNQLYGGILSGPMQSLVSQGGISRNNSDADRWQRASGTQRGLMPPPQGSMQVIHKSGNRYEVGKVSDEEEQKQRRLKAILNKLTPQNFEKLFTQVKEVNIDNTVTLTGVISQIFDKALMEPTFCEMYADFCFHLASYLPDFVEENVKITFRRLLLNKCQEEFERGEREEAEADKSEEDGEIQQSEAQREDKRIRTKRRMLGNIRLIGELYKKKMLTERIMHECIKKLLGQYHNLDEENIEALCKLMSTIGEMIDNLKSKDHMDSYFDKMAQLSTNQKLSSRVRFMLKDTIDLRKNQWQQRRKVEGPKKIEDVHRDAAQERQAQTFRSSRGPIITSKRGPPVDYGHRGSTILNSSSSQLNSSIRSLPGQNRGPGSQDVRLDDRSQFESRVQSVPLPQRPIVGGPITLGPQGGLAKGMSGRGQGLMSNFPLAEVSLRNGDSQRLTSGPYGFNSSHDRTGPASREGSTPKYMLERSSVTTNDQTSFQDKYYSLDRSDVATSGRRPGSSGGKMSNLEPKNLSEDILREKSLSAIREFYSANDEKEIVQCIIDLKAPSFYPSMVSLWVSDSFERKDKDRSLLAQLLVNLCKFHDSLIKHSQLIEGFESVLTSLEDSMNDAPKAAEFLGHIFGKVVVENLVPLREIGNLILQGGEIPRSLVESGVGSEILVNILEFIKKENGDKVLNEIRMNSNLSMEEFRPSVNSNKSKKLDAFL